MGSYYSLPLLSLPFLPSASQVGVDMETNAQPVINERLDELFHNLLPEAQDLVKQDRMARGKHF